MNRRELLTSLAVLPALWRRKPVIIEIRKKFSSEEVARLRAAWDKAYVGPGPTEPIIYGEVKYLGAKESHYGHVKYLGAKHGPTTT